MKQMKNSCIEWIGSIPQSWSVLRFKNIIKDSISGEVIDKGYWNDGTELLYTCQRTPMNSTFDKFPQNKRTTERDLLLTRNATPYVFIPVPNSIYSNVVQKVTLQDNWDKRYIRYAIQLGADEQQVNGDTIPSYNMDVWKNIYVCKIQMSLQIRIANFLDKKCSEIDALVSDIQSQIDVLEEYKKSIITESVTKGLNPDVEMKDSGIDWIGTIPKHYDIKPLKYLVEYNRNTLPENTIPDYEFDYVDIGSVTYGKGIEQFQRMCFKDAPSRAKRIVHKDDVILSTVRTYLKATATIPENEMPIIVSTGFIAMTANKEIDSKYLKYIVQFDAFVSEVESRSTGVSYPAITPSEVVKIKIILPPFNEQVEIANHLDAKCAEIDTVIADKKAQLETLAEYKKSLIYEYVTGKKEVL